MIKKYLWIFLISMIPVFELRGAIPVSQAMDLPIIPSYIICIVANILPVPIIYLFARKVLIWGSNLKYGSKVFKFFLEKGEHAGEKMQKKTGRYGIYIALMLFVGIPIPGTGVWTGTLASSILELDFKKTVIFVSIGVLIAGIIMVLASLGVFTLIENLL